MQKVRVSTLRAIVLFLFLVIFAAITLRWVSLERWHWRVAHGEEQGDVTAAPSPKASATPAKPPPIAGPLEVARLFNGITVHSAVETPPGSAASDERANPESYVLDLKLSVRVPEANKTIDELAKVNPELPRVLPSLGSMIGPDSVLPFFGELYNTKLKRLRDNLGRLDQLLSRHNFYDCQTILQLRHPETKRRAVLIQADMDVDSDGSDSDRLPAGTGFSPNFKPATSYRWAKKTSHPNPYLAPAEERMRKAQEEADQKVTTPERKNELRKNIAAIKNEIDTLKKFSFLIGATDPFIVLPGGFSRAGDNGKVGDYALVIFADKIYPAFVGDVGPSDKAGEASLRIAKEISAQATPLNRPVSDLKVTYLVFPETADKPFGPPDLEKIYSRCDELVKEFGGAAVPLHRWEDIIPKPTPTPTPTPTPSPTPGESPTSTTSPSPGESTPSASPSATFAFGTPPASPTIAPTPAIGPIPPIDSELSPAPTRSSAKKSKSPAAKRTPSPAAADSDATPTPTPKKKPTTSSPKKSKSPS